MATPVKKSKVITFRLPDEEFRRFQQLCSAGGGKSISNLVRLAVGRMLEQAPSSVAGGALLEQVSRIDEKVNELESRVEDLHKLYASWKEDASLPVNRP